MRSANRNCVFACHFPNLVQVLPVVARVERKLRAPKHSASVWHPAQLSAIPGLRALCARADASFIAMNLAFRTLKGDKFKLEASPSETVLDLKKKVVERYEDSDYSGYRLIYKGKVLNNDQTLSDAGVSEQGFVVVMPPKRATPRKPEPKPAAASSSAPAPPAAADAPPAAAPAAPAQPAEPATAAPAPQEAASTPSTGAPASALVMGAEYNASVRRIVEMDFPEADVRRALQAAFNNPERAVEYLCSNIPATADAPEPAPPAAAGGAAAAPRAAGVAAAEGIGAGAGGAAPGQPFNMFEAGARGGGATRGNLDFLRRLPPFNNMRRVIQSNPSVLHQLLQSLEQSDPTLLQLINANRQEFYRLLNEPVDDNAPGVDTAMDQLAQAMAAAGSGDDSTRAPGQVFVTEEEHQVINRLTELGSSMGLQQVDVVEAWLACDRDENLAANLLITQADDLRAQQAEEASLAEQTRRNNPGGPPDGAPPSGGGN